jgi:hypothetical protein
MRILGCRLSDEDGSIVVEWFEEREQTREGGVFYQSMITLEAQENWEQVGYYAKELRQDLEELVAWHEKHRLGRA